MADPILVTVDSRPPADTLTGAELMPLVQGGALKRVTAQEVANLAAAAAPPSDVGLPVPLIFGSWQLPFMAIANASTSVAQAGSITYLPFLVTRAITLMEIAIYVSTGAAGSATLGAYDSAVGGMPGTLIASGNVADMSTVGVKSVAVGAALAPGLYWLAYNPTGTPTVQGVALNLPIGISPPQSAIVAGRSGSVIGLPASAPAISVALLITQTHPAIYVRYT